MSVSGQQPSHDSWGANTWAFLTRNRVTWRQAGEASATMTVLAGAGVLVVAAAVLGRRLLR